LCDTYRALRQLTFTFLLIFASLSLSFAAEPTYKYYRSGNAADVVTKPVAGYALMGGGTDLDEAFRWMCQKAKGGDFVVLRATGNDDYNPYIAKLCKLNSVSTIVIPDKAAALEPRVAEIIHQAEAVFISGGDQSNYIKYWQGTPVQDAIDERIKAGAPIGGTSAGLAVMGQFIFSAMNDSAQSKETLANPFNDRVTIARDFVHITHLENIITDTHFAKRDRLGRFLGFMARIVSDGMSKEIRGIPIDEKVAALMEPDGKLTVVGKGMAAYFMRPTQPPELCKPGEPLTYKSVEVYKAPPGAHFDLVNWTGTGGVSYQLNVITGAISSTQAGGSPY
jgi:cyanophycinase